jgi:hypothetical protein
MKLHIYIPTRGRIDSQKSMKFFRLEKCKHEVTFVCPFSEALAFQKTYPWAYVETVPDNYRYGNVCYRIMKETEGRYKVIIDDDLQLLHRRERTKISQTGSVATDEDADKLFDRIVYWLDKGYVHGGISLRQTNHFGNGVWYKTNTRVSGLMFFDSSIPNQEGVRFDAVQERSDFHMTLSLLELGYENVCDYEFMVGQYITGTNAPGGCSAYRTPQFLLEQAELLAKLHPKSVKVVYKQRKAEAVKSMADDKGIPDVRIQWARSLGIRKGQRKLGRVRLRSLMIKDLKVVK